MRVGRWTVVRESRAEESRAMMMVSGENFVAKMTDVDNFGRYVMSMSVDGVSCYLMTGASTAVKRAVYPRLLYRKHHHRQLLRQLCVLLCLSLLRMTGVSGAVKRAVCVCCVCVLFVPWTAPVRMSSMYCACVVCVLCVCHK